ncbi:MAG: GxxExxY protein, partial [Chitinophagaceae bacterium]
HALPVRYEGEHVGDHRFDFALEDNIVVTLRTDARMGKAHHAQMDNLLHYFNLRTGILLNFGGSRFQQKRVTNKKYRVFPFSLN